MNESEKFSLLEDKKDTNIALNIRYGVSKEIDDILDSNNYDEIIDFLKINYNIYSDFYADLKIKSLFSNVDFLNFVDNYLKNNVKDILNSDQVNSFEEMGFYLFLIGQGNFTHVLVDINNYDYNKIEEIFLFLFEKIKKSKNKNDKQNFNLYLNYYHNFFEVLNILCIFNEVDDKRKNNIPHILHIIRKNNLEITHFLNTSGEFNHNLKSLFDWYDSRILLNFSHINFSVDNFESIDDLLDEAINITINQIGGFNKALLSNFGGDLSEKKNFEIIFLGNLNYIISGVYFYLKNNNIDLESLRNNLKFQDFRSKIIFIGRTFDLFSEKIIDRINKTDSNIDDINKCILDIYIDIYNRDNDTEFESLTDIIQHFIINQNIKNFDIETIYNIIKNSNLFDNLDGFFNLGLNLLNKDKFNNYNFEFFKLKIIILLLDNLKISRIDKSRVELFLDRVLYYIEKTKDISQLLNIYSRVYLSLANSYIELGDDESFKKGKNSYFIFSKLNQLNDISKRDSIKISSFYRKVGLQIMSNNLSSNYDEENLRDIGEVFTKKFLESYEFELKTKIDEELSIITEKSLKDDVKGNITNDISLMLSKNIFFGVAKTYIIDETHNDGFIKNITLENGIVSKELPLFNGYKLVFAYPRIYETIFLNIFEQEKNYITRNISNIISSYLRRRSLFIDEKTGFCNETKLRSDLALISGKEKSTIVVSRLANLSQINDGYGYEFGDNFIKDFGLSIQGIVGNDYQLYKLTGAQYAILIKQDNNHNIDLFTLIQDLKDIKIDISGNIIKVNSYIGVVENDSENLIEKAQKAISEGKKNTRAEGIYFYKFNPEEQKIAQLNLNTLSELDRAIEDGRLEIAGQGIVDAKSKELYKKEILLRVRTLQGNIDSPYKYLLVAEKYGRLPYITDRVIRETFTYIRDNGGEFSINVSSDDFLDKSFGTKLFGIAHDFDINPNNITLEILEGNISGNNFIDNIKTLKSMGFKIAMDDFGADNSNLNRLIDLLGIIDYLKIDGKIIKNLFLTNGEVNRVIYNLLQGIVIASKEAGVKTIAEFVENEKIADICEEIGIDYLQGFYYYKPEILKND